MQVKLIFAILSLLPYLAYNVQAKDPVIYDITKYGAKPGADIAQILSNIWLEVCTKPNASKIVIPSGTWTLSQVRLGGPNDSPIELEVQGTVQAYPDPNQVTNKEWDWISIDFVNNFTLSGGGVFDGRGQKAWKMNDCNKNKDCIKLPINLSFGFLNNSIIHDVTTKDSKNIHVNILYCHNVTFQRFRISAPSDSPDTDGIHIGHSSMINVFDSIIETGDNCVSMGDELTQVHIKNVTCGPGHGINIEGLGKNVDEKDVSVIYVTNCTFIGTQNGVRVKTLPASPATLKISDLHFEDLIMVNASNPIIIDQEYCQQALCKPQKPSLIQISKVTIKNIRGTTNTAEALVFFCSSRKPCKNVEIGDIDLTYTGNQGPITTKCANIKPTLVGKQNIPICATTAHAA